MPSISIVLTQYFANAAGYELKADGSLMQGDTTLLKATVDRGRITANAHYDILGLVAENVPDRASLSVRYAKSINFDKVGSLALACKAAPTVHGVLERMARYQSLVSDSVRYDLIPQGTSMFLRQQVLLGHGPGLVFSPEAGLSAMYSAIDQMAADKVTPERVTFRHDPPRDAQAFNDFFGCEIAFNADADGILFSDDTLKAENKLGDHALSEFLTKHLEEELEQVGSSPSLVRDTKEEIGKHLSEGLPKMADVARELGYSVRSFHRRLSDHGVNFQSLAEETRREIALGMLQNEAHTFSEIAFLTGFSEQSAFNRAFKRWTNQTPANYRKSLTP